MESSPSPQSAQSFFQYLQDTAAGLSAWIWGAPGPRESKWRRITRAILRVQIIFVREFHQDRIPLRASALTFTIILSLVPTLALGTAVLKGLGAGNQARQAAYRLLDQLEGTAVTPETVTGEQPAEPGPAGQAIQNQEQRSLTGHLRRAVDQVFNYVDRTDFATLGTFGIIGLVLAVITVLGSIEKSMNAIWQATASRPLGRKIMDYLALMILLPLAINLTLATEATLQSQTLRSKFEHYLPLSGLEHLLFNLMPFALLVATFSILYRFLPNTKVRLLPALAGGLFGGVLWLVTQAFYIKLQIGVARYNAIYGSFATLPLFLLWLQLGWIIFLSGAEMAFAAQVWQRYRLDGAQLAPITRLALAFSIIEAAHADFKARRITDLSTLSTQFREPETVISSVIEPLLGAQILRTMSEEKSSYLPGTPAETINPTEVVDLILGTDVPPFRGSSLAIEALQAARTAVNNKKITGSTPE